MASLGKKFDATQHDTEQRGDYENLPDGNYLLEVSDADLKEDRSAGKSGIKITYDVIEPDDYKGRKVFGYINIEHPNVQAQEIGQKELASLCRAMSIDSVEDTDDLKFHSFTAKVGMGKPSKEKDANGVPTHAAKNEIKRFFYPDQGDVPQPEITGPVTRPAANDNRRTAANDNKPATSTSSEKKRPWGK